MTTSLENPCRPGRLAIALLALASAALACGGCGSVRTGPSYGSRAEMGTGTSGEPITVAELDELTRAFADRYVGLLSSTCDALKKDNPDPIQRREAQQLLLSCATNVYDIASNPDAFTRMLDLVVVTTLVSQVWIDDDRAGDVFGDRDEVLVRALHHGRVEAWALASQVLRPDQLDLLDYTMWDWRRHNPDMVRTPFVRFSNFAIGRGKSGNAEVLAAGGFFAIRQASQAVDEARLLTERMFYMLKREPTLLRWEAEALKDDLLATPGVGTYLSDVHRLTAQVEALPKNVATEREAILAAFDQRTKALDATLADVKAVVADANGLVTAVGDASLPLNEMLKTAGDVFANYDAWSRWSATQPGRAFDIREYTEGVKELAVAVGKMNDVLGSSSDLLGSSEWGRRVEQVNQSADGRMTIAFDRSQVVVNEIFRRVYVALAVLFGLLILYRWISFRLARRLKLLGTSDGVAHGGNGRSTSPAQTAPRAVERGVLP